MRQLIVRAFNISLDGVNAEYGTEYFNWCMSGIDPRVSAAKGQHPLGADESLLDATGELYQRADALIMGRQSYENMCTHFAPGGDQLDHPWAGLLTAARKVVFSRTLTTADWANTTIAAGDTAEEVEKLRQGDGHIVVYGGISFWHSLMRLDLIDYFYLSLLPYVAGEGRRLFEDVGRYGPLDLISSTTNSNGILDLEYRRRR